MFYTPETERQALSKAGLNCFQTIWDLKTDWFEEPNKRRKGWSGVVTWPNSHPIWFIKRQENHNTYTFRHPIAGVPTYRREFKNLLLFKEHKIPTLSVSYYDERIVKGKHQAILITRALNHHQNLYSWYDQNKHNNELVIRVLQKLARLIRHMHDTRFFHYCLYPNHIFIHISSENNIDIKLIDLEKARKLINTTQGRKKDLDCLFRHTHNSFNPLHLEVFIETYLETPLMHAKKIQQAFTPIKSLEE